MFNDQRESASRENQENHEDDQEDIIRDIYALTPPHPQPPNPRSQISSSLSIASSDGVSSELFSTMSREFNALVLAGSTIANNGGENNGANNNNNLGRIGEEEMHEETNPLAIVPDNNPYGPVPSPSGGSSGGGSSSISSTNNSSGVSVQSVKKEEVETKISAWQNAKIAKLNNRFKREDAIINGWESEQVQKSTSWMKKVEVSIKLKKKFMHVNFILFH